MKVPKLNPVAPTVLADCIAILAGVNPALIRVGTPKRLKMTPAAEPTPIPMRKPICIRLNMTPAVAQACADYLLQASNYLEQKNCSCKTPKINLNRPQGTNH